MCYERLVATALWLAIWSIRNEIRGETTTMLCFTISAQHHLARMVGPHLSNLPPYTETEPNVSGSRSQVGSGVARNIELLGHCLCTLPKAVHRREKNFTFSYQAGRMGSCGTFVLCTSTSICTRIDAAERRFVQAT